MVSIVRVVASAVHELRHPVTEAWYPAVIGVRKLSIMTATECVALAVARWWRKNESVIYGPV